MPILLLAGAPLLVFASPPRAQQIHVIKTADPGEVDPQVSPDGQQAPKPTGDNVLDRGNLLEKRGRQLEQENATLRRQAERDEDRLETVETIVAKSTQFGPATAISSPNGDFTLRPRGAIDVDTALFSSREGGHDFNDGTALRRLRLGVEGSAFNWLNYRAEVDFAGDAVNITDAYLQYARIPKTVLTIGQHKAPFGLESNNSDYYNMFIERGMFTNAFGNAGAERRIGISAAFAPKANVNLAGGVFGDNESISRGSGAASGESWGVNGRATWEPLFETGKFVHLGVSGFYRDRLKSGDLPDAVRLSDRPNIRIDNGNIADSGIITNVRSMAYTGVEAAGVLGPLTVVGEAGRLWLDRFGADDAHFSGFYGYAAFMVTGETRAFKGGNFDRIRPSREVGSGGLGAFEIALRYDHLDLSDTPVPARTGNLASSVTTGLNWYFNPFAKLMVNWVRFWGDNSPLDPIGSKTKGDAFAARLHFDF